MNGQKVYLKAYIEQIRGISYKPEDTSNEPVGGYFPVLRANNIKDNNLIFDDLVYVNVKKIKKEQEIRKGDIIVCTSSGSKDLVGKAAQAKKDLQMSFGAFCRGIRPKNILPEYLGNYFKSPIYRKTISKLSAGANINNIKSEHLDNLEIPLPPMEEQKKIAVRLDAVSDLLAKQKQLLSEQDNLIQSTFYDMFGTPEINEKGFPAHKISEICELNPKKPKEIDDNTECSFVPMSAVSEDGELNLTQIKLYEDVKKGFTYFSEEDVLFAKITPCMENGKGTIAKGLKNKLGFGSTEFHVLRPLNDISNARWLFQITKFKKFRENAEKSMTGSAGQKRVPAGFFDNYFIPVPPFELQQKFAAVAEQIESEKSKIKSAITETQTLFNALMAEYFEE